MSAPLVSFDTHHNEQLTFAGLALAAIVACGVTSSTVTQHWPGCGHKIHRVNGDPLYHTCPVCYVKNLPKEALDG